MSDEKKKVPHWGPEDEFEQENAPHGQNDEWEMIPDGTVD